MSPLGLIAGGGMMPLRIADACAKSGRPVFAILVEGFAEPAAWAAYPHEVIRLGAIGRMVAALRGQGVRQIVLAGRIRRPALLSFGFDAEGLRLLARVGRRAILGGDDGLLSAVLRVAREEGFEPVGAQEVLADLLVAPGRLAGAAPDEQAMADIARGVLVCRMLGHADAGQACVVQQGLVLALEGIEGTDAMLARCGDLRREGPGGVLVKTVKPGQDTRVDLPAIGPDTVRNAAAAGLRGIVIEGRAGNAGTILLDRDATISAAEVAGLFLLAIRPEDHLPKESSA